MPKYANQELSLIFISLALLLSISVKSSSESLEVGVLITTGVQRALYTSVVQDFERDHPNITIKLIAKNDSDYKSSLNTWLESASGPDVLNWQGGERLYQHVRKGRIAAITDFWQEQGLEPIFSQGSKSAVSYEGERYALPIAYYQWGFFYRKSLFDKFNLYPPRNWQEFLRTCQTLKQEGVVPITIGNKNNWTSAAWFDYLNLRINGLTFHQDLLLGKISFKDPRVAEIFEHWKVLIDNGYFVRKQKSWDWNQALPFLYHKMAGMTLIGNFFAGQLPEMLYDDFGFFRFPMIDKSLPVYEEAPLDLFMIPQYSEKKDLAKKFLLTLSSSNFLEKFNEAQGMISPNMNSKPSSDYFIRSGAKVLNAAEGLSQFFDRDTDGQMANRALEIFTDFMHTSNIAKATDELETARQEFLIAY